MAAKAKEVKSRPGFHKLVKGYLGFLTGTGKSLSTIRSYQGDLSLLEEFLKRRKKDFYELSAKDFSAYQAWLETEGLRINTRRRKILSAKALVKYAVSRKKLAASAVQFVKAPDRLERLPWIPKPGDWAKIEASLPGKTALSLRNELVVRMLAETGVSLAELCDLRWDAVDGGAIELTGKRPRRLALSPLTLRLLGQWRTQNQGRHLFPGFNRYGVTSERMTPRGVELFFRQLAARTGFRNLKPKTLRHYAIARWLEANVADTEIQRRLGVHPNYSLDAYRKHLATT